MKSEGLCIYMYINWQPVWAKGSWRFKYIIFIIKNCLPVQEDNNFFLLYKYIFKMWSACGLGTCKTNNVKSKIDYVQ